MKMVFITFLYNFSNEINVNSHGLVIQRNPILVSGSEDIEFCWGVLDANGLAAILEF